MAGKTEATQARPTRAPTPRGCRRRSVLKVSRLRRRGETDDDLRHWLANASGKLPDDFHTVPAAFFWLEKPPVPSQYPRTASSLRALLGNAGKDATRLVQQLVRDRPDRIFAALGVQTGNGSVIASVIVSEPVAPQHGVRDPLAKGFRPHAVPEAILLARYFGGGAIMRRPVERADAAWVHGRGQDPDAQRLRSMTVLIIGCGSMGGPVAITLAQAGVGRIVLIDFDTLSWANVGRHPLGAACVNSSKAKGLAEKLRADFPHTTFEYHDIDVDTAVRQHAELLASSNLIVATTGSWAADGRLDAWHAAAGRAVPIVYGWMEPHACAGHALLLAGTEACLRCGFDGTGLPDFRVTTWPAATTRQEPACGAVFQPYGPVELGYVNSLVSELALDTLLNGGTTPLHRLWVGDGIRLRQLGGGWTSDWQVDPQFRDGGGFIAERAWPRARCLRCAKARAA
jgi:molybdopterin/thiamine biosynthesis adenylyltransferase